jgi:hypothetical protein
LDTLEATDNLAATLLVEDRDTEAEQLERASGEIRRRVLGPDHPLTASATYNYACANALAGKELQRLIVEKAVGVHLDIRTHAMLVDEVLGND